MCVCVGVGGIRNAVEGCRGARYAPILGVSRRGKSVVYFFAGVLGASLADSRRAVTSPVPTAKYVTKSVIIDSRGDTRGWGKRGRTSLPAFTKSEPRPDLERNVVHELANDLDVVSGHDHLLVNVLGPLGEGESDRDIGRADEELGTVVVHEGRVPPALLLGEDVAVGGELVRRADGAGEGEDHATLDLLALDAAKESAHVVAGLSAVELLVEHLDACR